MTLNGTNVDLRTNLGWRRRRVERVLRQSNHRIVLEQDLSISCGKPANFQAFARFKVYGQQAG